ncbi:MAG: hypothetical protein KatS3mg131_3709 [Candidatus Tectimicrobiota bacterium]|nr:MAG: hypothetical protein KatS3mg131_3709 [Candidatus Tectomicrobia bacterium]
MYLSFFNLREPPFSLTPDPRFLFLSRQHEEALSHLLYGIYERKGFIEITGEVGTGKTILCRTLLDRLDKTVSTALIFNSYLTELELLRAIVRDFGLVPAEATRAGYLDTLNQYLLEEFAAGRNAVVIVDEAQHLDATVLEQLRMLSNLETERGKLLQVVLVGQPELRDKLAMPHMRQLEQRIAVRYHIHGLSRTETRQYIVHRMSVAGAANTVTFTRAAFALIHRACDGIPRRINLLCDRVLMLAYVRGTRRVTATLVRQSLRELGGRRRAAAVPRPVPLRLAALAGVGSLALLAGLAAWPTVREQVTTRLAPQTPPAPPLPQPVLPAPPPVPVPPPLTVPEAELSWAQKLWRLAARATALSEATAPVRRWEALLAQAAQEVGLEVLPLQASLPQLQRLSRPCLIEVLPAAATASQLWVLVQLHDTYAVTYREPAGLAALPLSQLQAMWSGKLFLSTAADTPPGAGVACRHARHKNRIPTAKPKRAGLL